jgi:cytoskeleton protein RodZ
MSDGVPDDFSQEQSTPRPNHAAGQSLGQRLAAEREARGWSVEYVAGQLNLALRQIQALENENYAALPGIASVRGFVRAYAKLLKVDADPLVALIANEQIVPNQPLEPKPNLSSAPFSHSRLNGAPANGNTIKGVALALIVVLLAVGAVGIEHMGGWPTLSQSISAQFKELTGGSSTPADNHDATQETLPVKTAENGDTATDKNDAQPAVVQDAAKEASSAASASASVPVPVIPTASAPAVSNETPAAASAPVASAPVVTAPLAASGSASAPSAPAKKETPALAANAAASAPKAPAAAASGGGTLVLTARQNSWIDVRAGSNVIASHLIKAGETENIDVPGTAQLTIGNASGVSATFRGQALPSASDGKSNVAHITLK